ncbi:MAG TPA: CHASE3 domain-containing protein [Terriglobales bacterium]|nr:CHASE3 domain-containing protein [Terriglobales bacterium]
MTPRKKAHLAFASAVMLLFLSGLAAYITISRLLASEKWVIHTLEVKAALGDIDAAFVRAGRARSGYVISGADDYLRQFEAAAPEIPGKIQRLRDLTRDNPRQQEICSRLEDAIGRRVALFRESVQLKKQEPENRQGQADFDRRGVALNSEITSLTQQLRAEEDRLFEIRGKATDRLFILTAVVLAVAFILALALLALHFRLLSAELKAREKAEQAARNSQESLRRLTSRLLQMQDAERRKFSRELHDSLGQYLVGVKMNLEMFVSQRKDSLLTEAVQLLDQSIAETRTISHLLHPPLLDEAGLSSAAKWYLEGFAQRSGIEVKVDLPEDAGRLPKPVALGLFRVLQESLTNIHRHSNSAKAEVALEIYPGRVLLKVRDYGKGVPAELLEKFQTDGTSTGVGLAGMRERIRDLGGQLSIERCAPGTMIFVNMPFSEQAKGTSAATAKLGLVS